MNYKQLSLFEFVNEKQAVTESIMTYGVKGLEDRMLIEVLIKPYLSSRINLHKLTDAILNVVNGSTDFSIEKLQAIPGVSDEVASIILISLELGRRKGEKRKKVITCPADIYSEIKHYADEKQEHFIVIAVNGAREMIFSKQVSIGLVNKTFVHPRETFADAIKERASAIVVAHNHPSVNLEYSKDDIDVTKRIQKAGEILGIRLLDHIIFSDDDYYSFLEHGLL